MKRYSVSPGYDSSFFARTAATTKRINLAPNMMRGGIRL